MDNWNENDNILNTQDDPAPDTQTAGKKTSFVYQTVEDALGFKPQTPASEPKNIPVQPVQEAAPVQQTPEIPDGVKMTGNGVMYRHIDDPDMSITKTLNMDPAQVPQTPVQPQAPMQPQAPVQPQAQVQPQAPVQPQAQMQPQAQVHPAAPVAGAGFVMKDAPAAKTPETVEQLKADDRPLSYWG
ncbi:MAG: hypothetical protein IIY88_01940, partial [Eubacterium sp.]|nr:hypothetical protein [Eubacterium sp.]